MASIDRVMALAEELKKKKKDPNYEVSQSTINTLDLARDIQSGNKNALKDYISNNSTAFDAPIKTKTTSDKWYDKIGDIFTPFNDGYDMGDITKTIIGAKRVAESTVKSTAINVGQGLSQKMEGIQDWMKDTSDRINDGTANLLGIISDEEYKKRREKTQEYVEQDFTQERMDKWGLDNEYLTELEKNALITRENIGGQVAQGVGGMLPEIALALLTGGTSAAGTAAVAGKSALAKVGTSMALNAPSTLTMATGAYGQSIEEAYKQGATDEEALKYGIGTAAVEVATEWISGGIPGAKGTGLIDDLVAKNFIDKSTKGITKEGTKALVKSLEKAGFDIVAEGGEEALAEIINPFLKNATYSEGETIDWGAVMESAIVGGLTGGVLNASGTVSSINNAKQVSNIENQINTLKSQLNTTTDVTEQNNIKNQIQQLENEMSIRTRDEDEIYTQNEQAVIDAEISKRTEGKELTRSQKRKIKAEVLEDLQKGFISTETIESTLGGNTFNSLKTVRDNKTNLETQIAELENKPNAEITVKEMEQLKDLREQLDKVDTNTLETQLQSEMGQKIQSDGYLQRSYQERSKRSQEFTYKAAETDSEFRKGVMESTKGKLNDTTRSHETAEALVKLSEDRQMQYKFTNNAELKELGLVPEGKTANGLYVVDKDGSREILVNTDSKKYIEAVLVHETAHDFQTTSPETYTKLVDITKEFAEAQNDYSRVYSEVAGMYKNVKDANIDEEVTSRLLEDYLGNKEFINSLTTKEPNIVKKIINEIKYLVKKFTAGSPEARKLVELQHNLEKTYREAYRQTKVTDATEGTKYSISDVEAKNKENMSKREDSDKIEYLATDIVKNIDTRGRGNRASITEQVKENGITEPLTITINDYGDPILDDGNHRLEAAIELGLEEVPVKIREANDAQTEMVFKNLSELNTDAFRKTNTKYSLSDNQGRELSEGQQEYFKDSKIRDEKGNLEVVYHSTPSEFTVFDSNMFGENTGYENTGFGTFVTANKAFSERFKDIDGNGTEGYTMELYANVTNPITHPYKAGIKYGDEQASKIVEDYYNAIGEVEALEEMQEMVEYEEADNLYDAYMNIVQMDSSGIYEYADSERNRLKEAGYDAVEIIEGYESELVEGSKNNEVTSSYAIFDSNQLKNTDNLNPTTNEDINLSLSNESDIAPTSTKNQTAAQDIRLQVEEAIAPLQEEIAALREQINPTSEAIQPDKRIEDIDYAPAAQEIVEQQGSEAFSTIEDTDMPSELEDTMPEAEELTPTESLFDTRDYAEVGDRKIKAYQYENPEVRPFFQQAAREMLNDLDSSVKGERYIIGDASQMGNGDYYYSGNTRYTTNDIAELLDGIDGKYKYTYDEIRKGLQAIIEDNGKENNAASKRIEFYLDKRLREGYTDIEGYKWDPDNGYLDMLRVKGISDYYSSLPIGEAPVEEASNTEVVEDIAPVRNVSNINDVETTDKGKQQHLNLNNLGETLRDNNVDWDSVENTSLENAKQLTIDGTEEDLVKKTKKELRKALLGTETQKEFITDALDNAKNRSMAFMNNTDTIRNTELVFGRDAGRMINELIFQKEIDNEADSIKWQNKERDEIKALGIKARSKESAAVQKYGEKQYVTDAGEVIAYGDAELAAEFPNVETQNRIKEAAKAIRSKYDTYIDLANGVLTKLGFDPIKKRNDYMRHFQELNDVFSRWGLPFNAQNMQEHTLPTDINGLTEFWSPQKNYFANMQQRKGLKTTYDAITGVDGYIGGIANLIYHTEDIQRGRAFEELIRETYGEEKGFDNLDNLSDELKQLRAEKIQNNHLSNYAAWVHEWTNNVAGKKNKIDRSVEAMFGRKGFTLLDEARKQVGSNMIGFNLSSSLTNLIAPVQAMAKTNKLAVVKGTADTIKNIFVKDSFMDNNRFLTSRMGSDMISKNAWQKMQDAGFVFMKGMDWFSSNQIVRSKYYELRSKGMSEAQAHAEAGQFAARILGDRTKGANAQLYNSKLVGLVTQFQLEVNNQLYSMFYDTYHESREAARNNALKTAAGMTFTLGQLFAFTHLFGKTFESIAGYNPTFDVIGMLMTAFGWGDEEDEEKTTSERLKAAADQLVDSLPYVNILTGGGRIPVASGIPNVVGVMTGGKDEYGNELTWEDELKKLLYLVPPTGGNQVKKTYQGLSMFDEDLPVSGSYTDSGNLRFPVEDTSLNKLQAGLFGQWASENARNYFDNERQPLKEKQIQEYADLDMPIKDYWEYREGLKEQNTTQEKFDYINSLDVSSDQKNIMINNAIDRKDAIDMSNYDDFGGYEEFDYATKNPDKYRVIEQIDTYNNYISYKDDIASIKEQFSTDNGYDTKQRKAAVQQYIQSLNLDIPQKIMLEKMAGGYSIKSYESYMYGYIESLPLTAEEKQAIHNELFN